MLGIVLLFITGLLAGILMGYMRGKSIPRSLAAGVRLGAGLVILPTVPFVGLLTLGVLLVIGGILLVK